jgi:hypothetical protein
MKILNREARPSEWKRVHRNLPLPQPTTEQQHEQARPAARRGRRRVGASELEGLGIGGGQEAQGTFEGRITRTRKIRAPRRAPGDELQ